MKAAYETHGGRSYAIALRIVECPDLATQVVQDVFVALGRDLSRVEAPPESVSLWLIALTRLKSLELRGLSALERKIVVLACFEAQTQQEIAAALEVPLATVRKRMLSAMTKLRPASVSRMQASTS